MGIIRENFEISFSLKQEGIELWYLVCCICYWTSSKIAHMMSRGSNWPCSRGHKIETQEQRWKTLFFFFSETGSPSALMFCMYYLLRVLTSTKFIHMMPLGFKLAPPWWSQVWTWEQRRKTLKFFCSETRWNLCTCVPYDSLPITIFYIFSLNVMSWKKGARCIFSL